MEAGVAANTLLQISLSTSLLRLPTSSANRTGRLRGGLPVQPTVLVTFVLVSGMRLTKPELAELMLYAFLGTFRVESLAGVSTDPCCIYQASTHVLERSRARTQPGIAADFVEPSTLVTPRRWVCRTNLSQVAERVVWEWKICFTDPKLTIWILCTQVTTKRIKILSVKASTNTQFLHEWSTSVLESREAI